MTNASTPEPPKGSQGLRFAAGEEHFRAAINAAVDYRGDVTIKRRSSHEPCVGYVFALAHRDDPRRTAVRLLPADGGSQVSVPVEDITAIEFSGRDTAAGKSFETWVRKYVEKKLAGESASLDSEPLE